jgi:hypothetical protein
LGACADAIVAKLAELGAEAGMERMGFTKAKEPDPWHQDCAKQIAQAELAAYEKCRDTVLALPRYAPGSTIDNLVADWHKRNDPPKCKHDSGLAVEGMPYAADTAWAAKVTCKKCGMVRERGWLGPWEKRVDAPPKDGSV